MSPVTTGSTGAVDLEITGMTCASCAARIEKKLNRVEGVTATVNYATERAEVRHDGSVTPDDLVAVVRKAGYDAFLPRRKTAEPETPAAAETDGPRRLLISLALTVPVVALAMIPAVQFTYWQWLSLTLTAPVVAYGGWPFHRAAFINLRHGAATMDTLISMGTLAAFAWSVYALFLGTAGEPGMRDAFTLTVARTDGAGTIYLEAAAAVTTLILAGRYFETRAKRRAGTALRALLEIGAKEVSLLRDGREECVPIGRLAAGDRFVVRPGERIATDGEVVEGSSAVDAGMITGESVPVEVGAGEPVVGGTVNAGGRLIVRATRVGADTQLARMARLVTEAQNGKARAQRLADRISGIFVPVVIVLAVLTLAGWLLAGEGAAASFTAAVAVLIIACPCALGLATPMALMAGTGRGAQLGILVKGPEALESARRIDTVVLDKTGTITAGAMTLTGVHATGDEAEALRLAAAVEAASEHPIARAITAAAGSPPPVTGFWNIEGLGVTGEVDRRTVTVGRPALLEGRGLALPPELAEVVAAARSRGETAIAAGWDGAARAVLTVSDVIKATSPEGVRRLRGLGLHPILLTGDNEAAARTIAAEAGIGEVIAEVLPSGKVDVVKRLQSEGRVVAMVGDGVNDAAALAQSDLGLAIGTGTDAAIEAADLTLVRGDLRTAADAIHLSRRTLRTIKGNLFWAFAYNVAALPLAAAGLLNPMIAGAAMAFSSVFVVTNSLRLRRFRA